MLCPSRLFVDRGTLLELNQLLKNVYFSLSSHMFDVNRIRQRLVGSVSG